MKLINLETMSCYECECDFFSLGRDALCLDCVIKIGEFYGKEKFLKKIEAKYIDIGGKLIIRNPYWILK